MALWPRGSYISNVRRSSWCSRKWRRRSIIVAPGITPTPPTMTRVGMPSVCESTAWKTRRARIAAILGPRRGVQRGDGGERDRLAERAAGERLQVLARDRAAGERRRQRRRRHAADAPLAPAHAGAGEQLDRAGV